VAILQYITLETIYSGLSTK